MTNSANTLTELKATLGAEWLVGDNCLYTENENGVRFEITGACSSSHRNYFNVYVMQNGTEIAQAIGVPQEALVSEIAVMRKLAPRQ